MKPRAARAAVAALILFLFAGIGCAPTKTIWTSEPDAGIASNSYFQARLVPEKQGDDFFVSFRLEIQNRSREDLAIDWNNTLYVYNGQNNGLFVFKDITPEDVGNKTIPLEIIAAGSSFSKKVFPFKLLSKAPLRATGESGGISGGIMPAGENGMRLVIRHGEKAITEVLRVFITEQAFP